jgi:protein-L-isoaspartate(D-aspartate) O-methyltransferase
VLEIGTGSGYLSACLAGLAAQVTSLDIHADFTAAAQRRLRDAGITNTNLLTADAVLAWEPTQKYNAIVATGAVAQLPERWLEWLAPGGRLLVIRGQSPVQQAALLTPAGTGVHEQTLFETDLPYLRHAEPVPAFVF